MWKADWWCSTQDCQWCGRRTRNVAVDGIHSAEQRKGTRVRWCSDYEPARTHSHALRQGVRNEFFEGFATLLEGVRRFWFFLRFCVLSPISPMLMFAWFLIECTKIFGSGEPIGIFSMNLIPASDFFVFFAARKLATYTWGSESTIWNKKVNPRGIFQWNASGLLPTTVIVYWRTISPFWDCPKQFHLAMTSRTFACLPKKRIWRMPKWLSSVGWYQITETSNN